MLLLFVSMENEHKREKLGTQGIDSQVGQHKVEMRSEH